MKEILEIELQHDLDYSRDRDHLPVIFNDNSLLFKLILKFILLNKLSVFLNRKVNFSDKVSDFIPRNRRPILIYELEGFLKIDFPKLTMSRGRFFLLMLAFIIPFIGITVLYVVHRDLTIFPIYPSLFKYLSLVIITPAIIIGLTGAIFPFFLELRDFEPEIITIDDLLHRLIVDNYAIFSDDNYAYTLHGLDEIYNFNDGAV